MTWVYSLFIEITDGSHSVSTTRRRGERLVACTNTEHHATAAAGAPTDHTKWKKSVSMQFIWTQGWLACENSGQQSDRRGTVIFSQVDTVPGSSCEPGHIDRWAEVVLTKILVSCEAEPWWSARWVIPCPFNLRYLFNVGWGYRAVTRYDLRGVCTNSRSIHIQPQKRQV